MTWETHSAKDSFQRFSEDWDRLNVKLYNSHPYFDSRFIGALLDYFSDGKELLCIYRTNNVVSGALILQPDGLGRWSSFRPSQSQIAALMLEDAQLLESLFSMLPGPAWTIVLQAIDPRFAPNLSLLTLPRIAHAQARTIGIQLEGDFTEYWKKRPIKLISNIDRYSRRAETGIGSPVLSSTQSLADMNSCVERFGALESAGWKGAAGTAVSSDNQQGAFYSEVLRRFALTNQATVYELHFSDQLASSRLVIGNDHMVIFLKTTYDESLARFAPGRILLHRVIQEQFIHHPGKTIEFYTNATRDQAEWSSFPCTVQDIEVFRSHAVAASFAVLKAIRSNLRELTHRSATLDSPTPADGVKSCTSIDTFSEMQFDLHEFSERNNIETSISWFDLIQKNVYANDAGVRYYFTAEKSLPLMIVPLRLTTKGMVRTVESLGNYYTSLYSPLLTKDSDMLSIRNILTTASHDHGAAHVMRFSPMDPLSPSYAGLLNELRAIGWIPFKYFCFGNWFLEVNDNWQGYLKKRSANLRSVLKRRSKAFTAAGGSLEVVAGTERIEHAIDAFQEIYSASWKIPEPYPDFVPSLIRHLAATGMLRLGIARLQDKPVAAQLWIVGQDKASIYKVAYHGAFASYSPGTVLTGHLMQYVIEQDHVKEVDFLIGDDKYKQIWMSNRRERWGIVAYNPRTIIGLALFAKEVLWRMTKSIFKNVHSK